MKVRLKFKKQKNKNLSKLAFIKIIREEPFENKYNYLCESFIPKFPNIFFMINPNDINTQLEYKTRYTILNNFINNTYPKDTYIGNQLSTGFTFYRKILTYIENNDSLDLFKVNLKDPIEISKIILDFYAMNIEDRKKNEYYKNLFMENNAQLYTIITEYHYNSMLCPLIQSLEKPLYIYFSKKGLEKLDTYITNLNIEISEKKSIEVITKKLKGKKNQYKNMNFDWKLIDNISSNILNRLQNLENATANNKRGNYKELIKFLTDDNIIKENIPKIIKLFLSKIFKLSEKERIKLKENNYDLVNIDNKDWVKLDLNYQTICRILGNLLLSLKSQIHIKEMPKYANKNINFLLFDNINTSFIPFSRTKFQSVCYYTIVIYHELIEEMRIVSLPNMNDKEFFYLQEVYENYIISLFETHYIKYLQNKNFNQKADIMHNQTFIVNKSNKVKQIELYMNDFFDKKFNNIKQIPNSLKDDAIFYVYYNIFETELQHNLEMIDSCFIKNLKQYIEPIVTQKEFLIGDIFTELLKDNLIYIERKKDIKLKTKFKYKYVVYINNNYYFSNFQKQLVPSLGPSKVRLENVTTPKDKNEKYVFASFRSSKEESLFHSPKFKIITEEPLILGQIKAGEVDFCRINVFILNAFIENLIKIAQIKSTEELEVFYKKNPNFFYYFLPKDSNLNFLEKTIPEFFPMLFRIISYNTDNSKIYKKNIPFIANKLFDATFTIKYEIGRFLTITPILIAFFGWYPKLWSDARGRLYPEESGLNITKSPKYRNMILYITSHSNSNSFKIGIDKNIETISKISNETYIEFHKSINKYIKRVNKLKFRKENKK